MSKHEDREKELQRELDIRSNEIVRLENLVLEWRKTADARESQGYANGKADTIQELEPFPMLLHCPLFGERHIDAGEFAQRKHHTHACQACGHVWRPAVVATVGVRFLPGFKNS